MRKTYDGVGDHGWPWPRDAKSMFPSSWYPQSLRQTPAGMEAARKMLMNAEYVVRVYVMDINITGGRSAL